jgi:hypothetical protein
LTSPGEGATLSGTLSLSATVDADVPVTSVEFIVDDQPVGSDRSPPYTFNWNSASATTHDFHIVSARATDASGRVGVSAPVAVHLDNGPVVSQASVSGVTETTAWISWSTDASADTQVEYGPTSGYGQSTVVDLRRGWQHQQQLRGLLPNTTYHFRVRSRDARGNLGVSRDQTFTTR